MPNLLILLLGHMIHLLNVGDGGYSERGKTGKRDVSFLKESFLIVSYSQCQKEERKAALQVGHVLPEATP